MRTFSALCTLAGLSVLVFANMIGVSQASSTRNFFAPRYDGQPVAFCLDGNKECGKPTASNWCRIEGYDEALSYARRASEAGEVLRFVDTGNLCDFQDCLGFRQIKCVRWTD
jgi:hypothetical protein